MRGQRLRPTLVEQTCLFINEQHQRIKYYHGVFHNIENTSILTITYVLGVRVK